MSGWIAVDLDGTLAEYNGWVGPRFIGKPIPLMVERVKKWVKEGKEVRIFTARVSEDGREEFKDTIEECIEDIEKWCLEHLGFILPVTNKKNYAMIELWDDRAIGVELNTGKRLDGKND